MPKLKRRLPSQPEASQGNYEGNTSISLSQLMGAEMPLRGVVSENTSNIDMDVEDQELPHVEFANPCELPGEPEEGNTSYIKRVSANQLEFLAQCMERFPALALSRAKGRAAIEHSQRKWQQIASALNKINPVVTKTSRGWLRYWTDIKFKTRRKYAFTRQYYPDRPSVELTPFERRLLRILTDEEGNLLCNGTATESSYVTRDQEPEDYDDTSPPMPLPEPVDIITPSTNITASIEDANESDPTDEDPIGISKKTIEELQTEFLQFKLRRQKEMHDLEVAQMKERHKLEMEILELKKKKLIQEFDRIRQLHVTVERPRRGGRSNH